MGSISQCSGGDTKRVKKCLNEHTGMFKKVFMEMCFLLPSLQHLNSTPHYPKLHVIVCNYARLRKCILLNSVQPQLLTSLTHGNNFLYENLLIKRVANVSRKPSVNFNTSNDERHLSKGYTSIHDIIGVLASWLEYILARPEALVQFHHNWKSSRVTNTGKIQRRWSMQNVLVAFATKMQHVLDSAQTLNMERP